jgi:hypothetical protein
MESKKINNELINEIIEMILKRRLGTRQSTELNSKTLFVRKI